MASIARFDPRCLTFSLCLLIACLGVSHHADAATFQVLYGDQDCMGLTVVWPGCVGGNAGALSGGFVHEVDDPGHTDLNPSSQASFLGCPNPNLPGIVCPRTFSIDIPVGTTSEITSIAVSILGGSDSSFYPFRVLASGEELFSNGSTITILTATLSPQALADVLAGGRTVTLWFEAASPTAAAYAYIDYVELQVTTPEPPQPALMLALAMIFAGRRV